MKKKESAAVISQAEIAAGIFDMWIETNLAAFAKPGQFILVYPKDKSILLPRPISICRISEDKSSLRIVYRVAGRGTGEFSGYQKGGRIEIMGVLGNGFPLAEAAGKKVFLIGGGIGIPPLLQLAMELAVREAFQQTVLPESISRKTDLPKSVLWETVSPETVTIIAGYRDRALFLDKDLGRYGKLYIATEDGSVGTQGNVLNAIKENGLQGDIIFACGPMPMLRAVKAYAFEKGMEAYISLEEHMACGVGACLGCVAKTKGIDRHSHVKYARICTEGPVFDAQEVEIG